MIARSKRERRKNGGGMLMVGVLSLIWGRQIHNAKATIFQGWVMPVAEQEKEKKRKELLTRGSNAVKLHEVTLKQENKGMDSQKGKAQKGKEPPPWVSRILSRRWKLTYESLSYFPWVAKFRQYQRYSGVCEWPNKGIQGVDRKHKFDGTDGNDGYRCGLPSACASLALCTTARQNHGRVSEIDRWKRPFAQGRRDPATFRWEKRGASEGFRRVWVAVACSIPVKSVHCDSEATNQDVGQAF